MEHLIYFDTGTPFGEIGIAARGNAVTRVFLKPLDSMAGFDPEVTPLLEEARRQLLEYFSGSRRNFDLPLETEGTDFQKRVWHALLEVPYGRTSSYKELALAIGRPTASRAVGMANNRNPLAILVPCHRIVGTDGSLTGYAGGLDKKSFLLKLEKRFA